MNQVGVCFLMNDIEIRDMVIPYRDLDYKEESSIEKCIDMIQFEDNQAFLINEFRFSEFLN